MKKKSKIPKRLRTVAVLVIFSYIIVESILSYLRTNDSTYLILPSILVVAILIELAARYFGIDQRNH